MTRSEFSSVCCLGYPVHVVKKPAMVRAAALPDPVSDDPAVLNAIVKWMRDGGADVSIETGINAGDRTLRIHTLEGSLFAVPGKDVIIQGVKGEFYPCKLDIFLETYDLVSVDRPGSTPSSGIQNERGPAGPMDYPSALNRCLAGARIARSNWNGKGMWVALMQLLDANRISLSALVGVAGPQMRDFLVMKASDDSLVPWLCSQTDALATDWYVLGGQS